LRGGLAGLALAAALYAGYVLAGPNFHTVLPGFVYRCAQPSEEDLARLIRKYGIRTVVNLRGLDLEPWYTAESRVTNRLNVCQEDIGFSSGRLPSVPTLRQLVEAVDGTDCPILFHCHKGADRTGMASAIALLLKSDAPLREARAQLGPRYGHLPLGRTAHIDRFFDLYEEWLGARGLTHTPAAFRRWALQEYCPGECRCAFEVLSPGRRPLQARLARSFVLRVRCCNTSIKPWHMRPGSNAGIHAAFALHDEDCHLVADGRGGLFEATVAPGEHVDVDLVIPGPLVPGHYEVRVDMVDEQHGYFMQFGSEPLVCKLEVVP
jgi:hypothetical protein